MTRPYTAAILGDLLAEDRTWRLRELSDLKAAIRKADSVSRPVLLRALVTIAYAHWEGYVRSAARRYLELVSMRNCRFDQLHPQFLRNYFIPRLGSLYNAKRGLKERCRMVDEILQGGEGRFNKADYDLVSTRSNLNTEVMDDICLVCGVDPTPYRSNSTFIDQVLLARRNSIAHGENTFIDPSDVDDLIDTTISLMRTFGDAIENCAALESFRAPVAVAHA